MSSALNAQNVRRQITAKVEELTREAGFAQKVKGYLVDNGQALYMIFQTEADQRIAVSIDAVTFLDPETLFARRVQ